MSEDCLYQEFGKGVLNPLPRAQALREDSNPIRWNSEPPSVSPVTPCETKNKAAWVKPIQPPRLNYVLLFSCQVLDFTAAETICPTSICGNLTLKHLLIPQ